MKRCNRCGIEKPVEDFYRDNRKVDGRQGYCKLCDKLRRRDPGNSERNKRSAWLSKLKQFGITEDDYEHMFEKQMGLCAICHKPDNIRLAVDHDHDTGKVRGLLCKRCNMGIGLLNDDPDIVTSAALYLKGNK